MHLQNNFPHPASHLHSEEMYLGFPELHQASPDVAQQKSQSIKEVKKYTQHYLLQNWNHIFELSILSLVS